MSGQGNSVYNELDPSEINGVLMTNARKIQTDVPIPSTYVNDLFVRERGPVEVLA
jgi:hypothetical protein